MPLCDLPDDILVVILTKASHYYGGVMANFGRSLSLLAVCQRWRQLALPIAYRVAIIRVRSRPARGRHSSDKEVGPAEDSENLRLEGNLDLIASVNCACVVKRIRIVISYSTDPLLGLAAAASHMKQVSTLWARVDALSICSESRQGGHDGYLAGSAEPVVNAIHGILPGIRYFDMDAGYENATSDTLSALLAAAYSEHLRVYDGYPMPLVSHYAFKQLEQATLSLRPAPGVRPRTIDVGQLQYLYMLCLPLAHPWDMFFGDDSNGQTIVFPELTSLRIYYSERSDGGASQQPMQLRFPKLRSANVSCWSAACPLLRQAVFPARMTRFRLHAPADLFSMLDDVAMPEMDILHVALAHEQSRPVNLAPVTRFMSRVHGCKQRKLTIGCLWSSNMLEHLDRANLTSLELGQSVAINVVVPILERLQGLQELVLRVFDIRNTRVNMPSRPDSDVPLDPLNTSLRILSMSLKDEVFGVATKLALYLLMRLPSLTRFTWPRLASRSVLDAAKQYLAVYPHLRNAAVVFSSNC